MASFLRRCVTWRSTAGAVAVAVGAEVAGFRWQPSAAVDAGSYGTAVGLGAVRSACRQARAALAPVPALCCGVSKDDFAGGATNAQKMVRKMTTAPATPLSPTGDNPPPPRIKWDQVQRPILVGIAGPSGSGKSSVASLIRRRLRSAGVKCEIVSADSYYMSPPPDVDPANHNFDEPDALELGLLAQHLQQLKKGHSIRVPEYDFSTHQRLSITTELAPPDVLLVDGIFTFCVVELRDAFDLRIFVNADSDVCLARRLRRDIVERGRDVDSVLAQYERFVKPARTRFIAPSAAEADMILPHGKESRVAVSILSHELQRAALGWNRPMVDLYDLDGNGIDDDVEEAEEEQRKQERRKALAAKRAK